MYSRVALWQQIKHDLAGREKWVLARIDERLLAEHMLGLRPGDAHIFRNARGLITGGAIKFTALTTNLFKGFLNELTPLKKWAR